jgi:hypothetical protein
LRGRSHKRPRGDTGKYSSVFLVEKDGFAGGRVNFLGEEWAKRYNMTWNEFPSLNYIFKGIIFEAKLALQQKLGCQASTDWVVKGQKNIEEAWESILELVEDRDLPISRD